MINRGFGWRSRAVVVLLTACCLALGIGATVALAPFHHGTTSATPPAVPTFDHVFVVVDENHSYNQIIGSGDATYINTALLPIGGLATDYHNITHSSLPNYLGLLDGVDHRRDANIIGDCAPTTSPAAGGCPIAATNLADRLEGAGKTWKAYMESMPTPCALADAGAYAVRHNPFIYYNDIRGNTKRCRAHDVPYSRLASDLASANTTSNFVWITPNLCDDMHSCSIVAGDAWLRNNLPAIFRSPAWTHQNSLLVLTFDEGPGGSAGEDCLTAAVKDNSCIVVTLLIGSAGRHVKGNGYRSSTYGDHFSLLRTIEACLRLPTLQQRDASARPLTNLFAS